MIKSYGIGLLCTGESPGTTDWDPLARAISLLPSTSRTQKIEKSMFLLLAKSRTWGEAKKLDIEGDQSNFLEGILWLNFLEGHLVAQDQSFKKI